MCADLHLSSYRYAASCQTGGCSFKSTTKGSFPNVPSLQIHTVLLFNEAKLVLQRQSVDKRGNTKKALSAHVSKTISRGVKKEWDSERGKGGYMGRRGTTVAGKCSHSCFFFSFFFFFGFPPKQLLWSGEEFWPHPVWSLLQCDPVQMASSLSPLCLQHTAGTVTDVQRS